MLVRHELGAEASVLQTREISGRFFGLLGRRCIEVQASRDAKVLRRLPDASASPSMFAAVGAAATVGASAGAREGLTATIAGYSDVAHSDAATGLDISEDEAAVERSASLLEPMYSVGSDPLRSDDAHSARPNLARAAIPRRSTHANTPTSSAASAAQPANYLSPAMFEVFTEMLDAEVEPEAARTMLQEVAAHCTPEQLGDAWLIKGRLCQIIQQRIDIAEPIDLSSGVRHIVALVGPTGVGKTTTLAKLAAGFHFDQGTSVGFVTLDTFRLGAVDQLQKYADLLGAPCEVVSAPDQMIPALHRLAHCQLVFIDTAGRSPRDRAQLETLGDFLRIASPTQTHLVLSAASAQTHARSALEHFAPLNPTHLLLTKLDESTGLGSWYRLLSSGTWPLSYVTTGQHVPEDILVANRRRVASLILGQTNHLTWK